MQTNITTSSLSASCINSLSLGGLGLTNNNNDNNHKTLHKVNSRNIQLKKQYFTDKISTCQGNMKESWKAVNELLNKRSKSSNIKCLKEAGTETVHKKGISDAMNNFFCSLGKEQAEKIDSVPNPLLTGEYEVNANKAKFNFRTIEVKEIRAAFVKMETRLKIQTTVRYQSYPSSQGSLKNFFLTSCINI